MKTRQIPVSGADVVDTLKELYGELEEAERKRSMSQTVITYQWRFRTKAEADAFVQGVRCTVSDVEASEPVQSALDEYSVEVSFADSDND